MWRMAHQLVAAHWTPRRLPARVWCSTPTSQDITSAGSPSCIALTATMSFPPSPCHETPPSPLNCKLLYHWDFFYFLLMVLTCPLQLQQLQLLWEGFPHSLEMCFYYLTIFLGEHLWDQTLVLVILFILKVLIVWSQCFHKALWVLFLK